MGAIQDHACPGPVEHAAASRTPSRSTSRWTGKALPERSDRDHVDFDQARSSRSHGAIESCIDVLDLPHGLMRQAERRAEVREVRRQNVGVDFAAAMLRVLDVAVAAIALLVHQQGNYISPHFI